MFKQLLIFHHCNLSCINHKFSKNVTKGIISKVKEKNISYDETVSQETEDGIN